MSTLLSHEIVEQAADWFIKFRTGELPISEREEFLRWLHESPLHVQAYMEEALSHSDAFPLTPCDRLANRVDEPCSAAPPQGPRDGTRR